MRAGLLRESVTFQRQAAGAGDGMGNQLTAFADLTDALNVPAAFTVLKYGETVIAEGIQGRTICRVTVRYTTVLAGLKVNDRMVDDRAGTVYNVKSPPVNPDRKRQMLELLVETGGASG